MKIEQQLNWRKIVVNTKYNYSRKFYNKSGQLLTSDCLDAVAKEVVNDDKETSRYYVKFLRGILIDVRDGGYEKNKKNGQYKQVNSDVFHNYLKYLVKGGDSYLRAAERAMF